MADRFYVNSPLQVGPVVIQGAEAHHLAAVCRVRPGDQVCLFNGDGREYSAEVRSVTRRSIALEITGGASPVQELGFHLEIAAPLPRGDRGHFLVEKLTELGVTSFVPLRTRRSVVHPGERRLDRLERYVIEASKQCGRNVLLRVRPPVDWSTYCQRDDLPATRILAHPGGADKTPTPGQDQVLAVGPEGGLTQEEIDLAQRMGWQVVGLGPRILRIETAALALAALASLGRARESVDCEPSRALLP